METSPAPLPLQDLPRTLNLWDAINIVVGLIVASGIFLTTGTIAELLPHPVWILAVWVLGGLLSLSGALTFAELGAALPNAGGQYVYLRETFGQLLAFLFGWTYFLVVQSGGIAAVAVGFSEYFGYLFPVFSNQRILWTASLAGWNHDITAGQMMALCVVLLFSYANYIGVRTGTTIQTVFTVAKVAAIATIVIGGLFFGGHTERPLWQGESILGTPGLLGAFCVAMIAVLWAYDGWNNVTFVAGEVKNPSRNLPLALILGTAIVMAIYLVMNFVYIYALPVGEMKGVLRIAELAMHKLFGPKSGTFVAITVVLATLGSINAMLLAGARLYYAMARDNLFFHSVGRVHPRYQTPGVSLVIQALWTAILTLTGSYDQLFTYATFAAIIFYMATGCSVFILRWKAPHLERPYKTWGYPLVPLLYILSCMLIVVNTVTERPMETLYGLGLVALGVPAYLYWRARQKKGAYA